MNQTATVSHHVQCQSSRAVKVGPAPGHRRARAGRAAAAAGLTRPVGGGARSCRLCALLPVGVAGRNRAGHGESWLRVRAKRRGGRGARGASVATLPAGFSVRCASPVERLCGSGAPRPAAAPPPDPSLRGSLPKVCPGGGGYWPRSRRCLPHRCSVVTVWLKAAVEEDSVKSTC